MTSSVKKSKGRSHQRDERVMEAHCKDMGMAGRNSDPLPFKHGHPEGMLTPPKI